MMKKTMSSNNKFVTFFFVYIVFSLSSCINATDYEDVPLEQVTKRYVFDKDDSLGSNAQKFLNSIYATLGNGHNRIGGDYLDAASDDAISSSNSTTLVENLIKGNYSASGRISEDMEWGGPYEAIRKATIFVNNIDKVPVKATFKDGLSLRYAWKSEARFIRAWNYFKLLERYGGVPLMGDKVRGLSDDIQIPRSSFKKVVNYIVDECDAIKDSLRTRPLRNPSTSGHVVTKAAAMALKSRVLLYAASPLFNGDNIDPSNQLTGYTDYSDQRWKRAADAAREFMQENTYYSLMDNFDHVFTQREDNTEVIFFRQVGENTSVETENGPVGYPNASANGRTSPTQSLVESFPMQSGKPIHSSTSNYDPNNPYENRDPRLVNTILFNDARWLNADLHTFEDGRSKPNDGRQQTKTSYYMRKFMGDFEHQQSYSNTVHDWVIFRYAEILLNFAEAENEYAGPTPEVYDAIEKLRQRAGIDPGANNRYGLKANMSKDEMRSVIHNERRIEMAFEEQRYWDIKRWKVEQDILSEPLQGLIIVKARGNLSFNPVSVLSTTFEKRQYLYPIPYSEVRKNDNMVQNPGW